MNNYIVCIPTYKRPQLCNDKTLTTLHNLSINPQQIYVYVANKTEYNIYANTLNKDLYGLLVIGKKGLVQQRQFIMNQWTTNKQLVFLDDDIESIDLSLSPLFKKHNLDYFIKYAFKQCIKFKSYIWGVYPVFNPYFRNPTDELSASLKYIVGAFYGIINRPNNKNIQLTITKANGQKEDVERTIKYFIEDGIVLRFNKIGFVTKYYGKEGGLGRFEERIKPMLDASQKLKAKYPDFGNIKTRKNGMTEFVLNRIASIYESE
jgi:hypothetical protein